MNWPPPQLIFWLYDQNQEPKEKVYLHFWTLETLSPYLHQLSACAQTRFCCTNNNFIFTSTNQLGTVGPIATCEHGAWFELADYSVFSVGGMGRDIPPSFCSVLGFSNNRILEWDSEGCPMYNCLTCPRTVWRKVRTPCSFFFWNNADCKMYNN